MEAVIGVVDINSDGFKIEAREEELGRRRFGGRNNGDMAWWRTGTGDSLWAR
jgi:hypothetical protein